MSYTFYKVLHLSSLSFLLISTSAMFFFLILGNKHVDNPKRKLVSILHGITLVLVLVSGFGLLARLGLHNMPTWVIAKLLIWVYFGALPMFAKKFASKALAVWFSLGVFFSFAAYLAINKPF